MRRSRIRNPTCNCSSYFEVNQALGAFFASFRGGTLENHAQRFWDRKKFSFRRNFRTQVRILCDENALVPNL
jgi:hypothetical protein